MRAMAEDWKSWEGKGPARGGYSLVDSLRTSLAQGGHFEQADFEQVRELMLSVG